MILKLSAYHEHQSRTRFAVDDGIEVNDNFRPRIGTGGVSRHSQCISRGIKADQTSFGEDIFNALVLSGSLPNLVFSTGYPKRRTRPPIR